MVHEPGSGTLAPLSAQQFEKRAVCKQLGVGALQSPHIHSPSSCVPDAMRCGRCSQVVNAGSNFIPGEHIALYEACVVEKNFEKGRRIMTAMLPLMDFLEGGKFVQSIKAGCELNGLRSGGVRMPLQSLDDSERQALQTIVAVLKREIAQITDDAEVDTKPQLEMYADDVKCSHGATAGRLDAEQIYYLRSRGVDEAAARALLTFAFAADIATRVGNAPLRARLEQLLRARLSRSLNEPPGKSQ